MLLTLSGMEEVNAGLEDFEGLIAREGIATMLTIIAIIKTDTVIAKSFFMASDLNE